MSRTYGAICAAFLIVQCILQGAVFPLSELEGSRRLNNIDAPFHLYQLYLARELCEEREVVGYDPRFAAGYVGGVTLNPSAKLPALVACLVPSGVSVEAIYKQVSFWSGVLAPSLLVAACAVLGLSPAIGALAGLLGTLLWWTGALRWYHTAGMVSYVLVAYTLPLFVSAMVRWTDRVSAARVGALALFAATGFFVHPLFPVAAALLGACWLVADTAVRHAWTSRLCALVAVSLVMVATNLFWLLPSITAPSMASAETPYQRVVDPLLVFRELFVTAPTASGGSHLYPALLVGSGLALAFVRGRARCPLLGLLAGALLMMAWASVAALSPKLALLQPNRFSALAWLVLAIPAAMGIASAAERVRHHGAATRATTAVALLTVVLSIAYYVRETFHEAFAGPSAPRYGVRSPEVRGRAEIEDELVALRSGRELIGGPYPFLGSPSSWDGQAFGSDFTTLGSERLSGHLDAYGVRWLMCHTVACKGAAESLPGVRLVRRVGPVEVFDRGTTLGAVLEGGTADVTAVCGNRVELDRVTGAKIVLRYQWVPGLVAYPGGRVEPEAVIPDTPPFVAIVDPPAQLSLRIGSGPGVPCSERRSKMPGGVESG